MDFPVAKINSQLVNFQAVIEAIAYMAKGLKLEMVAEGVEEEFQLNYLRSLNCPVIKGFILSQAVTSTEARKLIEDEEILKFSGQMKSGESVELDEESNLEATAS